MNLDDTIAAVSSPPGAALRGIVRLSGPEAIRIASRLFAGAPQALRDSHRRNQCLAGCVRLSGGYVPARLLMFHAPRSYTRQDVVEFHLLGAPTLLGMLLEACFAAGARRADPGEFTARALLNGAMDFVQVHGVAGLIAAQSDHQLRAAERLLHGQLGETARRAREELSDLRALIEAAMDFADEPIEFIRPAEFHARLARVREAIRATLEAGLRTERWEALPRVVLCGPPNSGKSSLMNHLTESDRAICAPVEGTTRDALTGVVDLGRSRCLLVDPAGMDDSTDGLSTAAREAATWAIRHADLLLETVEATDLKRRADLGGRTAPRLIVVTKIDLIEDDRRTALVQALSPEEADGASLTSAKTGEGCGALKHRIAAALEGPSASGLDGAVALVAEHREALERALDGVEQAAAHAGKTDDMMHQAELVADALREAGRELGVLAGEDQPDDLMARIFSRFCIGK